MATQTSYLSLNKPDFGEAGTVWTGYINADLDVIDTFCSLISVIPLVLHDSGTGTAEPVYHLSEVVFI